MNKEIIKRHNHLVTQNDIVIHAGDFCWYNKKEDVQRIIDQLNGDHVFLKGCHDHWLPKSAKYIWKKRIKHHLVTVCHYAMKTWPSAHYNSWQLFAHSHGRLTIQGKQHDVGVDNNNFYPVSFDMIQDIMEQKPDNWNYIHLNN